MSIEKGAREGGMQSAHFLSHAIKIFASSVEELEEGGSKRRPRRATKISIASSVEQGVRKVN